MKDRVLKELGFVLDETTIAFFSIVLSRRNNEIIPTVTSITEKEAGIPDELRARLAASIHQLADHIGRTDA